MAAIKGKDTKPEIAVRLMLDTLKVKYELHRLDLPGKPDIVLPRRKKIIFVHGCFWHVIAVATAGSSLHPTHPFGAISEGRTGCGMRESCRFAEERLDVFTVWECWTKSPAKLMERVASFLEV